MAATRVLLSKDAIKESMIKASVIEKAVIEGAKSTTTRWVACITKYGVAATRVLPLSDCRRRCRTGDISKWEWGVIEESVSKWGHQEGA